MAQKVTVVRTMADDLDGTEWNEADEGAGRSLHFGWAGHSYVIDLKRENAEEFEKMMARYVDHALREPNSRTAKATVSTGSRRRGGGQAMGRSKEELAEIRSWARDNGFEVADSGLIPKKIVEAWEKRDEMIPQTQAQASSARKPGKAPGGAEKEAEKVSPLDHLIRPVSQQVPPPAFRGSDAR